MSVIADTSDSRRDIVRYKQKQVHKVLPSLSLSQKVWLGQLTVSTWP